MSDAIARLSQIRRTVEEAAQGIRQLGESGKRIGNIVEVIRQISEQTTMLALERGDRGRPRRRARPRLCGGGRRGELARQAHRAERPRHRGSDRHHQRPDERGACARMQTGTREVEEGTKLVEATLADLKTLVSVDRRHRFGGSRSRRSPPDEIARNMDAVQRIAEHVVGSSENAVNEGNACNPWPTSSTRACVGSASIRRGQPPTKSSSRSCRRKPREAFVVQAIGHRTPSCSRSSLRAVTTRPTRLPTSPQARLRSGSAGFIGADNRVAERSDENADRSVR